MRGTTGAAVALLVLLAAGGASADANRCAECHFASFPHVPAPDALVKWDQSAHAKHAVGCDACHGGNPTTYQPLEAHRGVLNSRQPLSTVNRRNLALTCAPCHAAVVAAFEVSGHAGSSATEHVPSCTTCHGPMATVVPSPARLESTCGGCHRQGTAGATYPILARDRLDSLRAIEQTLSRLEIAIAAIGDHPKRNRLAAELLLARITVQGALDAIHTFDFRTIDEQRALAQRRTSELVTALLASN